MNNKYILRINSGNLICRKILNAATEEEAIELARDHKSNKEDLVLEDFETYARIWSYNSITDEEHESN